MLGEPQPERVQAAYDVVVPVAARARNRCALHHAGEDDIRGCPLTVLARPLCIPAVYRAAAWGYSVRWRWLGAEGGSVGDRFCASNLVGRYECLDDASLVPIVDGPSDSVWKQPEAEANVRRE